MSLKNAHNQYAQEYIEISGKMKILEKRKKELAEKLKTYAQQSGVKNNKGSYFITTPTSEYGAVAKKTTTYHPEKSETFLKEKNLWHKAIKVVEKLDEKLIEGLVGENLITLDELKDITVTNVVYSVSVKEVKSEEQLKEEMPEVQVTRATKKSPFRRRG